MEENQLRRIPVVVKNDRFRELSRKLTSRPDWAHGRPVSSAASFTVV
jgi:hypothetical protein